MDPVFEVISLSVSVLIGFVFTALFSFCSITAYDLPSPKNETDRQRIDILKNLGKNFEIRSNFFIKISILIILISFFIRILISIWNVDFGNMVSYFAGNFTPFSVKPFIKFVIISFLLVLNFTFLILFCESLYVFFRLTETILSIIDNRREYLNARLK
jgi:hypothetical protein